MVSNKYVDEMWATWCNVAASVSNFAQCKVAKEGSRTMGSEPQFKLVLPTKSRPAKEDPGPYKARKMAHAVRRMEELQRNVTAQPAEAELVLRGGT